MIKASCTIPTEIVGLACLHNFFLCKKLYWIRIRTSRDPESLLRVAKLFRLLYMIWSFGTKIIIRNHRLVTSSFLLFLLFFLLLASNHWVTCGRHIVTNLTRRSMQLSWRIVILLKPHSTLILRLFCRLFYDLIISLVLHFNSCVHWLYELSRLVLLLLLLRY